MYWDYIMGYSYSPTDFDIISVSFDECLTIKELKQVFQAVLGRPYLDDDCCYMYYADDWFGVLGSEAVC